MPVQLMHCYVSIKKCKYVVVLQQSEAFTVTNAGVYDFWTSEIQWNDTSEGCLLAIVF